MSTGLTIVAIPSADDPVWKISSEKVPHLTLLFLGDQSKNPNVDSIAEYLEHTVKTSMRRFGLEVNRRGVLGDEDADVLFFSDHNIDNLKTIRSHLLKNEHIFKAYNSTFQYPSWIPHLTLGYPKMPAKPDKREHRSLSWVEFDRVALWTGDYEGPEFQLNDYYSLDEEVRMSSVKDGEEFVEEILTHFGVKGMKWGVRKDSKLRPSNWMTVNKIDSIGFDRLAKADAKVSRHLRYDAAYKRDLAEYKKVKAEVMAERAAARAKIADTKRLAKADKKWEKKATGYRAYTAVNKAAMARIIATEIPRINNKPEYKNKDFRKDSPLRRKYYKEYTDTYNRFMIEEHKKLFGTAPSGTKKLGVDKDGELRLLDVQHAETVYDIDFDFDDKGYIVSMKLVETSLVQSDLAHFGVKGMKWGVRRKRIPASEDAVKIGEHFKRAKKAGTKALSTKELQNLVNRMNLEQQYSRMIGNKKKNRFNTAHNVVKGALAAGKTMNEVMVFMNSPFGKLIRGKLDK